MFSEDFTIPIPHGVSKKMHEEILNGKGDRE